MKILTALVTLVMSVYGIAQMPKSGKLGENDGIPGLSLTKEFSKDKKGMTKLASNDLAWSDLKNANYVYDFVMLADPKKVGFEKVNGLAVERIEVFTWAGDGGNPEATTNGIYAIAVFLKLPSSNKELDAFYDNFISDYEPMLDMIGFSKDGYELLQWHSTTECGAMMNIPAWLTLEKCAEYNLEYLQIQFKPSCGG